MLRKEMPEQLLDQVHGLNYFYTETSGSVGGVSEL